MMPTTNGEFIKLKEKELFSVMGRPKIPPVIHCNSCLKKLIQSYIYT